jgi:hypothetical protein
LAKNKNGDVMKKIMILLVFLWAGIVHAQANDEIDIPVWEVVQRCVTLKYPIIPQSQWDFEGTIISRNTNGVHAIRSDMETGYYIALMSDRSFILSGAFSPDRQWFVYFLGNISHANWVSDHYEITHLRVFSTHPRAEKYDYGWKQIMAYAGSQYWGNDVVQWIDDESFVMLGVPHPLEQIEFKDYHSFFENRWTLVNFKSDEFSLAPEDYDSLTNDQLVKPDFKVMISDRLTTFHRFLPSPDGRYGLTSHDRELYMIDLENEQVMDFCLTLPNQIHSSFVWSPDGKIATFLYDDYLVMLDIETWQTQILDYQTSEFLHWVADEKAED